MGGLVRYVAERWGRTGGGRPRTAAESEMSPGVLMATGYIAGGAMAGVLVAFLSFSDTIPNILERWQFREQTITVAKPLDDEYGDAAAAALGLSERPERKSEQLEDLAAEIKELNTAQVHRYVQVPAGAKLTLPKDKTYVVPKRTTLGEIAAELGGQDNASTLLDLNEDQLKLPDRLPAGVALKMPQRNALSAAAFAALAAVLVLVGLGWIMKDKETPPDEP